MKYKLNIKIYPKSVIFKCPSTPKRIFSGFKSLKSITKNNQFIY